MVRRDWQVPRIKALRLERSLTVEELAAAAGITQGHVSRIERGMTGMSTAVAERIAEALGVMPRDLFVDKRYGRRTSEALFHALVAAGMDPIVATRIRRHTPRSYHETLLAAMSTPVRDENGAADTATSDDAASGGEM